MIECESVREWLPWYVSGQLSSSRMQRMAAHLAQCSACQKELAHVVGLRHQFVSNADRASVPSDRIREAVEHQLGDRAKASIDVGSFLVGLNIGIAARDRASLVRGDLRVLGRRVRIIGRGKKGA
jgi:anti-sigma factor RsiW